MPEKANYELSANSRSFALCVMRVLLDWIGLHDTYHGIISSLYIVLSKQKCWVSFLNSTYRMPCDTPPSPLVIYDVNRGRLTYHRGLRNKLSRTISATFFFFK